MATAANINEGGIALVSNLTFDKLGGTWVAVGLASAQCGGPTPDEIWVVYSLQPHPDGTLSGESVRALHQQRLRRQANREVHPHRRR